MVACRPLLQHVLTQPFPRPSGRCIFFYVAYIIW
uniref:Competence protein n=1 Tax=Caudovirales sp. ctktk4 TaxID=2827636 RepID=A0A8S5SLL2_9CAUD|nr:MAG TPA: competence protein [Caudovirales sp. ctktk4]